MEKFSHTIEQGFEKGFMKVGNLVAYHPIKTIIASVLFTVMMGGGYSMQEQENRPEKQWVATGTPSLAQNEYVRENWPSSARFNAFIAVPKQAGANVLQAKYAKRLYEKQQFIMQIVVDGDELATEMQTTYGKADETAGDDVKGKWVFDWSSDKTNATGYRRKCFTFGPFCAKSSVLDVLGTHHEYPGMMNQLTDAAYLKAVNHWESQTTMCPLSLVNEDSPCYHDSCANYKTAQEKAECRKRTACYCPSKCPMQSFTTPDGETRYAPADRSTCGDYGCAFVMEMMNGQSPASVCSNGYTVPAANNNGEGAPDGAFEFEPFPINTVVGGLKKDGNGKYKSGESYYASMILGEDEYMDQKSKNRIDYVAQEWEKKALCALGYPSTEDPDRPCPEDDLFTFHPQFARSWGDEFGAAIVGDLIGMGVSYILMIGYLVANLGRRDPVHRMICMSFVEILVILMSAVCCFGLAAYLGVPVSNLTNQVYFLLLGLGVDDAFVIVGEYQRIASLHPDKSVEEWVALAVRHGGLSIMITSVTDCLAFLIGSATVLPALSWFCVYAGLGVFFCFLFQIFMFAPILVLNGRRAAKNKYDCGCCCRSPTEHTIKEPAGCCWCCKPQPILPKVLKAMGEKITRGPVRWVVLAVFGVVAVAGIAGCALIEQDFKLEWFIPDDSYVQNFMQMSADQFQKGESMSVYTRLFDHFEYQAQLLEIADYVDTGRYIDQDEDRTIWVHEFRTWAAEDTTYKTDLDASGHFQTRETYYTALRAWTEGGGGARYRSSLKWEDTDCNDDGAAETLCDAQKGLMSTRFSCTAQLKYTDTGVNRYNFMIGARADLNKILPPLGEGKERVFPFGFQFLYWEEVGVVGEELWRNLLIASIVVLIIIFVMIPAPRIAGLVALMIVLSILETVGFCHFWGVSINGVSSIYILICVGLAVDYSAHIAHMFKESKGTAPERAVAALERIGPAVLNAIVSTGLAVIVLSTSKSFVFRTFFKVLLLVVIIAGSTGLVLLPAVLSLLGGDNGAAEQVEDIKGELEDGKVAPATVGVETPAAAQGA
eukprot:TRINITY_DN17267_c0_g1_i2.p1 TRINITY_DN17267_c0_g1~~TRINITY_DN17267_c0_g1_i2.p1  ORF type:complete len:1128 (+),score=278.62 TRINITY_DN17267_c0_g1_i2:231-3386(+)